MNYKVTIKPGYTASTIYLYHGDGTGQFITAGNVYNHVTGLHANLKPAVVVIYSDSVVEELVAPEVWEGGYVSDTLPATVSRPASWTPPTTVYSAINTALSDNGHTLVPAPVAPVVDEVVETLYDGTQSVWVLFSDSTRELYWLYTNGIAEPQDGLDGKPFCYCTGESCVKHSAKPTNGTKCRAYHEDGDYDPQGKKRFKCFEDDADCD